MDLAPTFQKIVDSIKLDDPSQRIVTAGLRFMFDPKTHKMLIEGIEDADDPLNMIGKGVAGIVVMMKKRAKGTMPPDGAVKASVVLLMHALDFAAKVDLIEESPEVINQSLQPMMEAMLSAEGITPDKMGALLSNVQSVVEDPAKFEAFQKANQGA
jgi:hypothetical protein